MVYSWLLGPLGLKPGLVLDSTDHSLQTRCHQQILLKALSRNKTSFKKRQRQNELFWGQTDPNPKLFQENHKRIKEKKHPGWYQRPASLMLYVCIDFWNIYGPKDMFEKKVRRWKRQTFPVGAVGDVRGVDALGRLLVGRFLGARRAFQLTLRGFQGF